MANKINSEVISVREILKKNFNIPSYQRNYNWDNSNIFALLDDINNIKKEEDEYFLGNLICSKENNILILTDGQQRIISIFLIIISIIHFVKSNNIDLSTDNLKELISKDNKVNINISERTNGREADVFSHILTFGETLLKETRFDKSIELIIFKKILNWFKKNFLINIKERLENFIYNLLDKIKLVLIYIDYDEFKLNKIFLNINTKGKKLSPKDEIKNYIIEYISKKENKNELFSSFKEGWNSLLDKLFSKNSILEKINEDIFDEYFMQVLFFLSKENKKIRKKEIVLKFNEIFYKEKTDKNSIIDTIIDNKKGFSFVNSFCYLNNLQLLNSPKNITSLLPFDKLQNIVSLDDLCVLKLNYIISYYIKFKYSQFNCLLLSIIYTAFRNKKFLRNNFDLLLEFLTYNLFFFIRANIKKEKPSLFTNDIYTLAFNIYNYKNDDDFKKNIKSYIDSLKFNNFEKDFKNIISNFYSKNNDKISLSLAKNCAKFISQIDLDHKNIDLKIEHFISQSFCEKWPEKDTNNFEIFPKHVIYSPGNILTVSQDNFGNKKPSEKIEKYKQISDIKDEHLKNFLIFLNEYIREKNKKNDYKNFNKEDWIYFINFVFEKKIEKIVQNFSFWLKKINN